MHRLLNAARIKTATELARSERRSRWLSDDPGTYGHGRLVLRISPGGGQRFYYRPPRAAGRSKAIPLGQYSRTTRPGYLTLTQARKEASHRAVSFETLPVLRAAETLSTTSPPQPSVPASSTAMSATTTPTGLSLIEMCRNYVQYLKDAGKISAKDVEQEIERFIAPSKLANQAARQITPIAFTNLLRDIIKMSSGRTAGKVRSYLHAAYARALKAVLDPSTPKSQLDYGIGSNPISAIDPLAQYKTSRDRYLRDSELREVWRSLQSKVDSTIPIRGLRLCILLGGQRGQQITRIKRTQVDLEAKTILILDGKGRRAIARQHLLPLLPQAEEEVRWLMNYAQSINSPHLLPGSKQGTVLNASSISTEVRKIHLEMEAEGLCTEHFEFGDLRRTAETKLASLGVSKDHRAQLQSHGLSGVQQKHYDRHDYMREKRDILILWEGYLAALIEDAKLRQHGEIRK